MIHDQSQNGKLQIKDVEEHSYSICEVSALVNTPNEGEGGSSKKRRLEKRPKECKMFRYLLKKDPSFCRSAGGLSE